MNKNLVTIDIKNDESLLEACDILHDAKFDISQLQVDENAGVWRGRFEREFFEDPSLIKHESKFLILVKGTFPLADSELRLDGVKSYEIQDKSKIGIYTFNECKIVDGVATLFFCEDMKMIVTFRGCPSGSLIDHKLLDKRSAFYFFRNPFRQKKRDARK